MRGSLLSKTITTTLPAERERRGIEWRAVPGSHDLAALGNVLSRVRRGLPIESLRRYDMERDMLADPISPCRVFSLLLLDGWLLRTGLPDYQFISEMIDYLVYLDADEQACRHWRFQRERDHRRAGLGYSEARMAAFWDKALQPILQAWVLGQRERADSVVAFDKEHEVVTIADRCKRARE